MDLGIGRVGELVRDEGVADLGGQRARRVDGLVHPAQRLGDLDTCAVEAQQPLALAAHALRQRQDQVIALSSADERQGDAGVAGRRLDDRRATGLDAALGLGGVDHRHADAVLHRSGRIVRLDLRDQLAVQLGRDARQPHQRRAADQVRQVGRDLELALGAWHQCSSTPAAARRRRASE